MTTYIECDGCGLELLALELSDPKPLGRRNCPRCGGTEFAFLDG